MANMQTRRVCYLWRANKPAKVIGHIINNSLAQIKYKLCVHYNLKSTNIYDDSNILGHDY